MIVKKNIFKVYLLFLITHLVVWTFIPSISNTNLPLDTIEALAWGSNLDWGFNKHPPFSAFAVEFFFYIFGSYDWVFYFLSQIFIITAFVFVWKLSKEILDKEIYALFSIFILEGIFFYNFTSPEFNVNISQLPFWALTVYFFWRGINTNKVLDWILFGVFSALGFLSKYLFIYILASIFLFLLSNLNKNKKFIKNYFLSVVVSLIILTPHFFWLYENNFITISYGLNRATLTESHLINHLTNPLMFLLKQTIILIPFLLMIFVIIKKFKPKIDFKNYNTFFLFSVTILPFLLVLITSILTGAKIRTMWMTPFYLFLGTFFFYIFKKNIEIKKLKKFIIIFTIFFIISPVIYLGVSVLDETKRTDYPGKEIARLVQNKWDDNFVNDIKIVVGDEWFAGNLSYHLSSRPIWINDLKDQATSIRDNQGVIYVGNPKILKKICPGIFGTIKPVGYCMIGKK
tara:strand:+ start:1150 stop:2523 length:1374 start_codon:yes stop_codon:yes gene_type:complete